MVTGSQNEDKKDNKKASVYVPSLENKNGHTISNIVYTPEGGSN